MLNISPQILFIATTITQISSNRYFIETAAKDEKFITDTIYSHTVDSDVLTIIYEDCYNNYITNVKRVIINFNINKPYSNKINNLRYYYNYVILTTCENLQSTLSIFRNSSLWYYEKSIRGNYMVFLLECKNATQAFETFWNNQNIYNVLAFIKQNNKWSSYTYDPFSVKSKCGRKIIPKAISNLTGFTFSSFSKYLNDCSLNTSNAHLGLPHTYFVNPNSTPILLGVLILLNERYGINCTYFDMPLKYQEYGYTKEKIHIQEELIRKEYDIIAAAPFRQLALNLIDEHVMELSDIAIHDLRIWIMPRTKRMPPIKILFIIFSIDVLITVLITTIIAFAIWYFIGIYKGENPYIVQLLGCIFSFEVRIPKSRIFKFLFIFYVIYGQHVNYFFQGNLSSKLTIPQYEKRIKTIEQLIESNLIIILPHYDRLLISSSTTKLTEQIYKKSIPVVEFIQKTSFVKTNQSVATTMYLSATPNTLAVKDYVEILIDTALGPAESQFILRTGHPLLPMLNMMISRVNEHGFIIKWSSTRNATFIAASDDTQIVITTQHLQSVFVILCVGYFIGFLVLLIEIYKYKSQTVYQFKKKKNAAE